MLGEIKPEEIVSMTADNMASDENEGVREYELIHEQIHEGIPYMRVLYLNMPCIVACSVLWSPTQ